MFGFQISQFLIVTKPLKKYSREQTSTPLVNYQALKQYEPFYHQGLLFLFCFVFFFLFMCVCVRVCFVVVVVGFFVCVCLLLLSDKKRVSETRLEIYHFRFRLYIQRKPKKVGWLCWGLTSQSTIFQSCRDGTIASWVINQYFRGVKCLAQGHNTAAVGFEPRTSRSGVRHSTTEPPRSPYQRKDLAGV